MKFEKVLILPIIFILGCSSNQVDENETPTPSETISIIEEVTLSERNGEGQSQSYTFDTTDEESLTIVEDILTLAVEVEGIADMIEPDYKMTVERESDERETYSVWWTEEEPDALTLMDWIDTHTIYTLEGQPAQRFQELIE